MSKRDRALKRDLHTARAWAKEGRWDEEAAALNTKILQKAPSRTGSYLRRGRCYLEMGMIEEAERDFEIALSKEPRNREAQELLGEAKELREEARERRATELIREAFRTMKDEKRKAAPVRPVAVPFLPSSAYTGSGGHSVYVVELDPDVLKRRKFRDENPSHVPGGPCVYVGLTGLTPEERFANHTVGYKASRYVRDFGIRLVPDLYAHLNPMPFEEAQRMEEELTRTLREAGYAVWSY